MKGKIKQIDYATAVAFLLPRHYSGRVPTISKAFGWYADDVLVAVCTFGKPASPYPCQICWKDNAAHVYELNRLCRLEDWDEPLSEFVAACLRMLKSEDWIVLSYSDTAMNHHGYIYQACNFLYTGCSKPRTDKYVPGGGHSRHYKEEDHGEFRLYRYGKHRYVFFCTRNKRLKKEWAAALKYPVLPYPKGDNNSDYTLGDYLEPTLVPVHGGTQNE